MLGHEYAERYLTPEERRGAAVIADQVRDALLAALERNGWLSAQAKAEARAKLQALKIEVGTPRRDLDYSVQPMGRGSFGGNMLIASTWRHREEMKRIGKGNADRRWDVLPQEPALAYDIAQNRLIVTAAVLQPPVFDAGNTAVAYGGYGALVGTQLSRAIDARGAQVNAKGELGNWWTPSDNNAWTTLGDRVAAQYSAHAYPGVKGGKVNGALVRDVALSDQGRPQTGLGRLRQGQYRRWRAGRPAGLLRRLIESCGRSMSRKTSPPNAWPPKSVPRAPCAATCRCPTCPRSARPTVARPASRCSARRPNRSGSGAEPLAGGVDGKRRGIPRLFLCPDDARALFHPTQVRRTAARRPPPAEWRLPAPVADHQPAEQHAAEVGEMGHPGLPAGEAQQQADRTEHDHERARLHRDRREQQHHPLVREQHPVGQQQAEHATGRTQVA